MGEKLFKLVDVMQSSKAQHWLYNENNSWHWGKHSIEQFVLKIISIPMSTLLE